MYQRKRFVTGLLTFAVVFSLLISCGGKSGDGGENGGVTNPVASAGPDQDVLTGSLVTLDGSGSSNASSYVWSFTAWPGAVAPTLSPSATVSQPAFTAAEAGAYVLSLIVSNGTVASAADTVTVTAVNQTYVPDTGQTLCYLTADGQVINCSNSGQDGEYNDIVSQPSFSDNGDETITDNVTGLMWQKCTMGESGANCATGTVGGYNWYEATGTADTTSNPGGATNACGDLNLGGYSDWRLPTDSELMTLIDYSGSYSYAINTDYFPGTEPALYWSATTKASPSSDTSAWNVVFRLDSSVGTSSKSIDYGRVRCVRGVPSAHIFTDNGLTVTDVTAKLMWQKQDDGTQKTWDNAIIYCEGLSLDSHNDWRLPNVKELRSIVDTTKEWGPAVNETYFTGTQESTYWSSTTYVYTTSTTEAWTIGFVEGGTGRNSKASTTSYARCVRSIP